MDNSLIFGKQYAWRGGTMIIDSKGPDDTDADDAAFEAELAQLGPQQRRHLEAEARRYTQLSEGARDELEAIAMAEVQIQDLVQLAEEASRQKAYASAVDAQEQAVILARTLGEAHEVLLQLSQMLYQLAGYYQAVGRCDDALFAMEEVVVLDQRTDHPDLASDQAVLEQIRQMSAAADGDARVVAAIKSQMSQAPPETWALLEEARREFADLSQEDRAKMESFAGSTVDFHRIQQLADQTVQVAVAALRGQEDRSSLAEQIEITANRAEEGELPGSPWSQAASFIRAVAALLRGQAIPPVPAEYADRMAAVKQADGLY